MKKRFLNLFLVLVMVVCVLPMAANAAAKCHHSTKSNNCTVEKVEAKAATCAEDGYEAHYYCTVCEQVMKLNGTTYENATKTVIPATGEHDYSDFVKNISPATCTKARVDEYGCKTCDATITKNHSGEVARGHDYQLEATVKEPTCTEKGMERYRCSRCGSSKIEYPAATGHDPVNKKEKPATCVSTGTTAGKQCRDCKDILEGMTEIPATGEHDYSAFVRMVSAATCTEARIDEYKCQNCDATMTKSNGNEVALGHQPYDKEAIEPTCTTVGRTAGKQCGRCKEILEGMTEIPMTAHTSGKMIRYITRPTCQATGEAEYECTGAGCEATVKKVVSKLNCEIEELAAEAPTCNNTGLTAGTTCTTCSEGETNCAYCAANVVAQEVVPALGHDQQLVTTIKQATCTKDGKGIYDCTRCGYDGVEKVIPKLGHDDVEDIFREPTCTVDGCKKIECSRCGTYSLELLPATGHTEEIVSAVPATCTATGLTEGKKCSVCGEILEAQEVAPLADHVFETPVEAKPVSCTEDGYTAHMKCNFCDATQGKEEIDTDGHSFENYICTACGTRDGSCEHKDAVIEYTAPTCTNAGSKSFRCPECNYEKEEVLSKLGHQEEDQSVAGTCTTKGREHVVCTVCKQDLVNEETDFGAHNIVNGRCTVCGTLECAHSSCTTHTDPATCTRDGSSSEICDACGMTVSTHSLPALGHSYVSGICSVCGHKDSNRVTYDYQDVFLTQEG